MHELSIAQSILDAVSRETLQYPGHYATRVSVRIGYYAGVDPESLSFCFQALSPIRLAIESTEGEELDLKEIELESTEMETAQPEEVTL